MTWSPQIKIPVFFYMKVNPKTGLLENYNDPFLTKTQMNAWHKELELMRKMYLRTRNHERARNLLDALERKYASLAMRNRKSLPTTYSSSRRRP